MIRAFSGAWDEEVDRAQIISQPNLPGEVRISKQIWALQESLKRGEWLNDWIVKDWNNWYKLNKEDKVLLEAYTNQAITCELTELRKKQQPKFSGTAERIATSVQSGALAP